MARKQGTGYPAANGETAEPRRAFGVREAFALILAVLAGISIPLAVVASWTRTLIDDTDTFVQTYSPVLQTEAMQRVITDELTTAIVNQLGVAPEGIAGDAVAVTVEQAVATDAVSGAKLASLGLLHTEVQALLLDEPGHLDVEDGRITLRFEPFVSALQQRLADAGVPFVGQLPQISGGVTLLAVDPATIPRLQLGALWVERAATSLPWVVGTLLFVALLLSPRRSRVLVIHGLSVALAVLAVGFGWDFGVEYGVSRLDGPLAEVAETVAEVTSGPISGRLEAIAIAGVVVAVVAVVAGRRVRR